MLTAFSTVPSRWVPNCSADLERQCEDVDHQFILAGGRCNHIPYSGQIVSLEEIARYSEEGCQCFRIISSAVHWAVSSLLGPSQIKEIDVLNIDRISIECMKDDGVVSNVSLSVFQKEDEFPVANTECSRNYRTDFPTAQVLPETTSSESTITQIQSWLADCVKYHDCSRKSSNPPKENLEGIRFISIQGNTMFLVEDARPSRYACLSHCWGSGEALLETKTTSRTLKRHLDNGISFQLLPKTFQDAIEICQRLGINHLWIDSFCIVQDSDSDWRSQAARMSDVYKNAFITIAASSSSDATQGCFRETQQSHRGEHLPGYPSLYVREDPPIVYHSNPETKKMLPLLTRGWVFQELVLSPRVVHFGSHEVGWQCQTESSAQSAPRRRWLVRGDNHFPGFSTRTHSHVSEWREAVETYSWRGLTFQKDRLPAIAALAKEMLELRPDDQYIAGLWRSSLLTDLVWHNAIYKPFNQMAKLQERIWLVTSDKACTVPSWSWASVSGLVRWTSTDERLNLINGVQVLDLVYEVDGPSVSGVIQEAKITVRAPLISLSDIKNYVPLQDRWKEGSEHPTAIQDAIQNPNLPTMNEIVWEFMTVDDCGFISDCSILPFTNLFLLFLERPAPPIHTIYGSLEALLVTQKQGSNNLVRLGTVKVAPRGLLYLSHYLSGGLPYHIGDGLQNRYIEQFAKTLDNMEQQVVTLV
jgi:hypothetical protein